MGKGGSFGGEERPPEKVAFKFLHKGKAEDKFNVGSATLSF